MTLDLTALKKATRSLNEAVFNACDERFISQLSDSKKNLLWRVSSNNLLTTLTEKND